MITMSTASQSSPRRQSLRRSASIAVILATSIVSIARGQDEGDIGLQVINGAIATSFIGERNEMPSVVFGSLLGELGVPGFADEPGFDGLPATFAPGSLIGFTIHSPLRVWDGRAFVLTAPDPLEGERMRLSFLSTFATTGAGEVAGFQLAVSPSGEWHYHLGFQLLPAAQKSDPAPGIYLLELSLASTDQQIGPSPHFWILFNHEIDESQFDAVFAAAAATLGQDPCSEDLDRDGDVEGADLGLLLSAWGEAGAGDLDGDGVVGGADLGLLLSAWGSCN